MGEKRLKGVPREIEEEMDIYKEERELSSEVTAIVEKHQVKLPIPSWIRIELGLKKGKKVKVKFDKNKKEIVYKF